MRSLPVFLLAGFLSLLLTGCFHSKHRPIDVYLTVESDYGSPTPPVGSNYLNYGMTITASVDSPVSGATEGTQYVCTGWTGAGSAPATGSTNSVAFVITENSSITWQWALLPIYLIYVDGTSGQDTNDGLTWETAVKTIQTGLDKAADGWMVIVANGTYTGAGNKNLDFAGKAIHLKSVGGAENCIIDCENSGRGFYFHSEETPSSVVGGFTVQNGYTGSGGGILCNNGSSPAIANCILKKNVAYNDSGGICFRDTSGATLVDCTISENSGTFHAGGVYCTGSSTITNCTIMNNHAWIGFGGGICCQSSSSVKIVNCTIANNSAYDHGGGVYSDFGCQLTLTNCNITGNSTGSGGVQAGGGIYCDVSCQLDIVNCAIISNNTEGYGGGICCARSSSPVLNNSIAWGNSAVTSGNEIYISDSPYPSSATLNNCDVTPDGYGGVISNITENNCIHSDPLFVDAANRNYRLQNSSPCVDAGDNSLVPAGITTDLDGNPRIVDGDDDYEDWNGQNESVDIGAYEYQP